jgi:hypothetical protein
MEVGLGWVERQKRDRIVVPTIMHSGSRILRYRVLEPFDKVEFHLTECKRFRRELEERQVFTSLRHPRRIRESFKRREEKRTKSRYPYNQKYFDLQWREMIDRIAKLSPYYLHVDHPAREKEIDRMEDYFNMELSRDFTFTEDSSSSGTWDIDIEECPEVPQEYIDFYYETMP